MKKKVAPEPDSDDAKEGELKSVASSILMKVLYAARLARFDLLKAVANLASKVSKCDRVCDRKLHRLICYINSSLKVTFHLEPKLALSHADTWGGSGSLTGPSYLGSMRWWPSSFSQVLQAISTPASSL